MKEDISEYRLKYRLPLLEIENLLFLSNLGVDGGIGILEKGF